MKVNLLQNSLHTALSALQRAVPSKPSLPILGSVYIQAHDDTMTVSATDLFLGITTTFPCKVSEAGSCAVPGKIFIETVSSLDAGEVEVVLDGNQLSLVTASGTSTLSTQSGEDYPAFPQPEGKTLSLETVLLDEILGSVGFSASSDVTRPVLTGLFWQFSPTGLEVVGTDGYRLSIWNSKQLVLSESSTWLLPTKALQEVSRSAGLSKATTIEFTISEELKQVWCKAGDVLLFIRLLDGDFPPYRKIIPSSFACEVEFDTAELQSHLKRALIFARDSSNIVKWEIQNDTCIINATSALSGNHEGKVPVVNTKQANGEIAFNARYVLDFLQVCKSDRVWFGMSESLKPALFRPVGSESLEYVVMPFRVQE